MLKSVVRMFAMAIACVVTANHATAQSEPNLDVDGARIQNADNESGNWMSHGRSYDEQRFSPLESINDQNVGGHICLTGSGWWGCWRAGAGLVVSN